jgi:hypothetical protein
MSYCYWHSYWDVDRIRSRDARDLLVVHARQIWPPAAKFKSLRNPFGVANAVATAVTPRTRLAVQPEPGWKPCTCPRQHGNTKTQPSPQRKQQVEVVALGVAHVEVGDTRPLLSLSSDTHAKLPASVVLPEP